MEGEKHMKNEPIMTSFSCLDNILGGYRPGTINVIAGRGLAGKTSIALNIAQNVARTSGKAVAYYSGKESKAKITERLIKANIRRLSRSNRLETVDSFTGHIAHLPLYIDDKSGSVSGCTAEHIVDGIKKLKDDGTDIGLIIIDDYELIVNSAGNPGECWEERFDSVTGSLRAFACKSGIPMLLIADIPYIYENRETQTPTMKDLENYAPYVNFADTIGFLSYPKYSRFNEFPKVQLIIGKNSNGASNVSVDLDWNDKRLLFSEAVNNPVIRFEETVEKIIEETARYFGCTQHRIRTGPNSFKKNYERMVAIAVCEDMLGVSNNKLEKHFGLVTGREKIAQLTSVDPDFEKDVEAIKKCIGEVL